jgi:transcriptional repressor NrdR
VIKQDGKREPFNEDKLRHGLSKALEKRPVSAEAIESAVSRIKQSLRTAGEREIKSRAIGGKVMEALRELDEVAYVRFASVYLSFEGLSEFREVIERLQSGSDSQQSGKRRR